MVPMATRLEVGFVIAMESAPRDNSIGSRGEAIPNFELSTQHLWMSIGTKDQILLAAS